MRDAERTVGGRAMMGPLAVALAAALALGGCADYQGRREGRDEYEANANVTSRFDGLPGEAKVFTDTETGVRYLVWMYVEGYGEDKRSYNGVTVLLDADGRPLVDRHAAPDGDGE